MGISLSLYVGVSLKRGIKYWSIDLETFLRINLELVLTSFSAFGLGRTVVLHRKYTKVFRLILSLLQPLCCVKTDIIPLINEPCNSRKTVYMSLTLRIGKKTL